MTDELKLEDKVEMYQGFTAILAIILLAIILFWISSAWKAAGNEGKYDVACQEQFGHNYKLNQVNPADIDKNAQTIECMAGGWDSDLKLKTMHVTTTYSTDTFGNPNYNDIIKVSCNPISESCRW